jgi:hypothetical protein
LLPAGDAIPARQAPDVPQLRFASSSLAELYTPERLGSALQLQADTLETGLWVNDGSAKFTWRALPRVAQIAPSFGAVMADLDADGDLDIALAQNSFSPQRETGRMDGGLGEVLLNDGTGEFAAPGPAATGVVVPGDAKSLTVADVNSDGRPDLAVGVADGPVAAFENASVTQPGWLEVRLPASEVGARVTRLGQTQELTSGGGYRSQSPPSLWFRGYWTDLGSGLVFEVQWPDGTTSHHYQDTGRITLTKP